MKNIVDAQLSSISAIRTLQGAHRVPQCRSRTENTRMGYCLKSPVDGCKLITSCLELSGIIPALDRFLERYHSQMWMSFSLG